MKRKLFFPALIFTAAIISFAFIGKEDPLRKNYADGITAEDLKNNLSVLASDSFRGRETGTADFDKAANYVAEKFYEYGVWPVGWTQATVSNDAWNISTYFQKVPLRRLTPGNGTISVSENNFVFGNDFYYTPGISDGTIENSQVVFAGYGIQDSLYKDYCCSGVYGKIEMILADEPHDKKGNSIITGTKEPSTWSSQRRRKINEAKRLGATALLIVVPDYQKRYAEFKDYIMKPTLELDEDKPAATGDDRNMPVLYISKEMAEKIFKSGKQKQTIDKIISRTTKTKKNVHFEFAAAVKIDIHRKAEKLSAENVLGYIEGGDLKNELVVVTAHLDHLGVDSTLKGDKIFNGADDDGSGSVSVLEIAKAFAKAKAEGHGPRRSMLFMLVTGEEKGLLGSKWYTDHPVFPLASTVVDLNIDMIGRTDDAHKADSNYVYVIGSDKLSAELKTIDETEDATYTNLKLDYRYDAPDEPNNYYGRSDHYNFAKHFVPIAFFFNGVHADYHKVTDEVSKINFPLMEKRARLVFYIAWEIANRDKRIALDKK